MANEDKGCQFCLTGDREFMLEKGHRVGAKHIAGTYCCMKCLVERETSAWRREKLAPIMEGL